jgi:tetratricopeptide (TPR) repeat protein
MRRRTSSPSEFALLVLTLLAGCQAFPLPKLPQPETPPVAAAPKKAELDPTETAKICQATGELLEKDGKNAEAIAMYERARQMDPKMQWLCRRLAVLHDELGEFTQAQREYDQALLLYPKNAALLNDLGYSYYCRGRWVEAEEKLREAVALNAKMERAWINLGMALGEQGRYAESLEAFGKAVPPGQAQCNLAFILTTQGKLDQAKRAYAEALTQDPDLRLARNALAKLASAPSVAPVEGETNASVPLKSDDSFLENQSVKQSPDQKAVAKPDRVEEAKTP